MIRSEISFPFQTFYHNFATLKEFQKSFVRLSNSAPSLKLFSKIFFPMFYHSTAVDATPQDLPHAIEDMGGIWFATQFWVSGVGAGHYEILPIQPAHLKKTAFPTKPIFLRCQLCHVCPPACSMQPLTAACSHLQPLVWLQMAVRGNTKGRSNERIRTVCIRGETKGRT